MTRTIDSSKLRKIAVHEVGHAIVGLALGVRVVDIKIWPASLHGGEVGFEKRMWSVCCAEVKLNGKPVAPGEIFKWLCVDVAGLQAVSLETGDDTCSLSALVRRGETGPDGDRSDISEALRKAWFMQLQAPDSIRRSRTEDVQMFLIQLAEEATRRILRERWSTLQHLAEALLGKADGTLLEEEVLHLYKPPLTITEPRP